MAGEQVEQLIVEGLEALLVIEQPEDGDDAVDPLAKIERHTGHQVRLDNAASVVVNEVHLTGSRGLGPEATSSAWMRCEPRPNDAVTERSPAPPPFSRTTKSSLPIRLMMIS